MDLIPNPLIIPVGLIIGILVAAPVGPVNVLCIQRAIERGFWGGVAAGIGAVLGDGLIALFAALSDAHRERASLKDFAWDIPQTFFLTITNPGAVLGLFAIFGGVSTFVEVKSNIDALTMVAAIMGGSRGWWILLSEFIGRIRHRIDPSRLGLINRIAGIALIGFGGLLVGEIVFKMALAAV